MTAERCSTDEKRFECTDFILIKETVRSKAMVDSAKNLNGSKKVGRSTFRNLSQ